MTALKVTLIDTVEKLEEYKEKLRLEILARNPDRDFVVLFGDLGGGRKGFVALWLDGRGKLND